MLLITLSIPHHSTRAVLRGDAENEGFAAVMARGLLDADFFFNALGRIMGVGVAVTQQEREANYSGDAAGLEAHRKLIREGKMPTTPYQHFGDMTAVSSVFLDPASDRFVRPPISSADHAGRAAYEAWMIQVGLSPSNLKHNAAVAAFHRELSAGNIKVKKDQTFFLFLL